MFEGLAKKIKGGSLASASPAPVKTKAPAIKQSTGPFSGLADTIRSREQAKVTAAEPPKPITALPTPPAVALSPVLTRASNYLPKVNTPVTTAPVPAIPGLTTPPPSAPPAPPQAPTLGLGARKSALPIQAPVGPTMTPDVAAKFGPLLTKTAPYLPTVAPKPPETITAPKPTYLEGPGAIPTAYRTVKEGLSDMDQRAADFVQSIAPAAEYNNETKQWETPKKTASDRGIAALRLGMGAVNTAFLPVTAALEGAANVQLEGTNKFNPALVGLKGVATGAKKAFELVGRAGEGASNLAFENVLPQTPEVQKFKGISAEVGAFAAMLLAGKGLHEASKVPAKINELKTKSAAPNEVISAAKTVLDIEPAKSLLTQEKRSSLAEIRDKFEALKKADNLTPEELAVAEKAKTVLEDYSKLSQKDFAERYKTQLEEVQKAALKVPDVKAEAPKPIAPKLEVPKVEMPKAELPKTSVVEAPKPITSKTIETVKKAPILTSKVIETATKTVEGTKPKSIIARTTSVKLPKTKATVTKAVKFDPKNLTHKSILTDVMGAEAFNKGAQLGDISSGIIYGRNANNFAKWIPSELRRGPLVKSVMKHINDGTLPVRAAENQLYRVITNQMKGESTAPARKKVPRVEAEALIKDTSYRDVHQINTDGTTLVRDIDIGSVKDQIKKIDGYINNSASVDLKKLEKILRNPGSEVRVYRASPVNELNAGDWVTTNKSYANTIAKQNGGKVYTHTVKADDLRYPKDIKDLPSLARASAFKYDPSASITKKSALDSVKKTTTKPIEKARADTKPADTDFGRGKSKVGESIEAKAIEKKLTDAFDTAGYDKINIKDQIGRATDLVNNDIVKARKMLSGDESLPDGLRPESLLIAMEEMAMKNGDAQLALDVANSPFITGTSAHAQAMRLLAERDPDSAVAALQRLKKIKEEASKKSGKAKETVVSDIKKSVDKVKKTKATKESWNSFIENITC